jgi:hypothetical protein
MDVYYETFVLHKTAELLLVSEEELRSAQSDYVVQNNMIPRYGR